MSGLDRTLREISLMGADELRLVRAALERRARELGASTIVERRGFRDGLLQLEYRLERGGAMRGPYWYFRYRRDGAQRVLYLGRTETSLATKRATHGGTCDVGRNRAGDEGSEDGRRRRL